MMRGSRCGMRRTCASIMPGRWRRGARTWISTGPRRSRRSAWVRPGCGGCTWPGRGWGSTVTTSSCIRCWACGWPRTGGRGCRCGPTGSSPGCSPVKVPNGPGSPPRRSRPPRGGRPGRAGFLRGDASAVPSGWPASPRSSRRPRRRWIRASPRRAPHVRGLRRMRGTCAILCACVPSGCFLPSRADLPSLARLPLVSRGVFIAGGYHSQGPDRINGEETMTAAESADLAQRYDPRDVQEKWQARWAELEPFRASEDPADPRERFYLVDMFPYPSGDLHMRHAEAYAIGDALARYHFLRGENVLHPIGWDAFGLPAENAAIRNNSHPADWTYANIATQAASFRRYATSFDWSRRLQTCDPAHYHWNQWLFLRFYERCLAYRRDGYVNWCPVDQTVLANEQVIAGKCERCGADVVRRMLNQWY